jgi:hypothetical protein
MTVRLVKISESQFAKCVEAGVWGSQVSRFGDWAIGDIIAFTIDRHIAALAEVRGPAFVSETQVWDNGLFPHRIPITFVHVLEAANRVPVSGRVKELLQSQWGPKYGLAILSQRPLMELVGSAIVEAVQARANALHACPAERAQE